MVLGYIKNEVMRFHFYVANKVQQIRDLTDPNAWSYVDTTIPQTKHQEDTPQSGFLKDLFGYLVQNS